MALLTKSSACLTVESVGLVSLPSTCSDPSGTRLCFELSKVDGKAAVNSWSDAHQ